VLFRLSKCSISCRSLNPSALIILGSFLDSFDVCGFEDVEPSDLPDWDFGDIGDDIAGWMNEPVFF
jgi:hypothetical protein